MSVPDEAVEAAAKVLWEKEHYIPWASVAQPTKASIMLDTLAMLEAAAPFIAAQAIAKRVETDLSKVIREKLEAWLAEDDA